VPGANFWEPPGSVSSLLSGRKIDASLRIAGLFADNTMQAKYLERQSHTLPAGSPQALLREAAGRAKVVIIHRAPFEVFAINAFYILTKRLSNGISHP
jgi:hypothetical protein